LPYRFRRLPLRSPPYSMRVLARRLYRRQPWLRYHILLKAAILSDLFSGSKPQIPFDTDGIGDIMSCFFTIPVSIISSILSACNCLWLKYYRLYRISQTDNTSYAGTKANYNACFTLGS
jgi:hypothetical protein